MSSKLKKPWIPKIILLVESSRGSGRALLRGIANYAHHHGPWSFYWEPGGLEKAWPALREMEADGVILRDVKKVDEALASGLPAVVIGHRQSEIPGLVNVVTDSEAIGRMGAEHLLQCGFEHFAFCGYAENEFERTVWSEVRCECYAARILEAGFISPPHFALSNSEENWPKERRSLARWLESLPKPLGLMACNDDCAQQVMEACKLAELKVPDQVGVIGVDNDEVVCGLTDPPLSSVVINFERAGYDAARALDGLMRHLKRVPSRITAAAPHIVTRRSTDFVAVEDTHLAHALRFIRDHPRADLSVDDVARAAGLSRRALEKRFRVLVGHSILSEIRRVRTDHIARLLLETDLPVSSIAETLGFSDAHHFARYFRAGKQTSPLRYRRAHASYGAGAMHL
ncbi:MAG TPA: DNA-binding transcriptional regulator [Candidatus Limnocylindrales bacterium]|nr:DNA-binding transcriptional regulator [Candidatus Limnocylindrales bacterium]